MNKRRLLKLADLLIADASKRRGIKFNLEVVGQVETRPDDDKVELNCGTQACAMGLAAISGAFKRAGLGYVLKENESLFDGGDYDVITTVNGRACQYDSAAMKLFDLTKGQADFLFSPSEYRADMMKGAKAERFVAKRIRDLVAGKVTP